MTIQDIADAMSFAYQGRLFRYVNSDTSQGWIHYSYMSQRPSVSWSGGAKIGMRMTVEVHTNGTILYRYEEYNNPNKIAKDSFSTRGELINKLPSSPEAFLSIINTRGKTESIESMGTTCRLLKRIEDKVRTIMDTPHTIGSLYEGKTDMALLVMEIKSCVDSVMSSAEGKKFIVAQEHNKRVCISYCAKPMSPRCLITVYESGRISTEFREPEGRLIREIGGTFAGQSDLTFIIRRRLLDYASMLRERGWQV